MGICYYCYWGWPKPISEIYKKYINVAGQDAMHYGAAHIVWDDENFERYNIQWCLDNFETGIREDSSVEENNAVRASLGELLKLPDEILDSIPEDYDDCHPEKFPPKIEMIHT